MSGHPLRRRDRGARLDEDYIAAGDSPYYDYSSPRRHEELPPRRDRTRKSRRPASPELYAPQPRYESPPPARSRSTREPASRYDSPPRRRRSPPPAYGADPSRRSRGAPAQRADPYDRDPYGGAYADPRSSRGRYDEPDGRSRRNRTYSLSPERRARGGRDRPPPAFDNDSPPRRHRSSAGRTAGYAARGSSPPQRDSRPPPATAGRPQPRGRGQNARRNSMPAAMGPNGAAKPAKAGWWTNPLIQASARTAFTAGAQAAMNSRKDAGPWIGPKGAKVASAALMGGFMDGFMGQKKQGEGGGGGDRDRGRGGSHPPQSSMKSDLMREGMMAALGKFGSRR